MCIRDRSPRGFDSVFDFSVRGFDFFLISRRRRHRGYAGLRGGLRACRDSKAPRVRWPSGVFRGAAWARASSAQALMIVPAAAMRCLQRPPPQGCAPRSSGRPPTLRWRRPKALMHCRRAAPWGDAGARSTSLGRRRRAQHFGKSGSRRSSRQRAPAAQLQKRAQPDQKASEICNFLMRAWPCSEQFSRNEKTQAKLLQAELFEAVSAAGMQQL